jgi:hypothetical protein
MNLYFESNFDQTPIKVEYYFVSKKYLIVAV